MKMQFTAEVWHWRGPSPYHFVTVPERLCAELADIAGEISYGWGMIPVHASLGGTAWTTSLFPKNGGYIVPIKDKVRNAEDIDVGDVVTIVLTDRAS
ncbi:DUF1905 domain-containing protein [Mangrovihabitans endophyticus]|uniref:DUF1905 domain-containing protein n=1 Tax=Mangrovihabitans endophyticus TaxID=1751298 RepID=A0A8J3FQN0_9ACTN|nr:DUF1905 domain-containing protein [Mangrovihabitans endophyticus]GGL04611.1 hypothetical protein GCM10012284_44000 [Mangrovihabitans endophyticus]